MYRSQSKKEVFVPKPYYCVKHIACLNCTVHDEYHWSQIAMCTCFWKYIMKTVFFVPRTNIIIYLSVMGIQSYMQKKITMNVTYGIYILCELNSNKTQSVKE